MSLSALILAGGLSSRMGRDKAWLEVDGQSLLQRQISLVRELGVATIFISGRPDTDYSAFGCPVLHDAFPDAGPLAGIERGLANTTAALLLVLAVDLPKMNTLFLLRLAQVCDSHTGVVPVVGGRVEPLVAFYPRATHSLAVRCLTDRQLSVQSFVAASRAAGLLRVFPVGTVDEPLFLNCNTPDDLPTKGV